MNGRFYDGRLKERARNLRAKGKTYSEIKNLLGIEIPKSTLSSWSSNVELPTWYQSKINKLNQKNLSKAQRIAFAANQIKREDFLDQLFIRNKHLVKYAKDKNVLKLILSTLYLGEGTKWKSHRGLVLGSSDPNIIKLYLRLLNICYGVKSEQLRCRVSYRADQDIKALERYWSKVTLIPLKNFYKTIPDPRTVGKPTRNVDYKGVCVIMTGLTEIQLELELIPRIILEGL